MKQQPIPAYLQGLSQGVEGERFPMESGETLIGRGTQCQIQLQDPKVSRKHARITIQDGSTIIEDLKSSHGTLLNGQRVLAAELKAGDELTFGDTRLRFELAPDAVATMMVAGELGAELSVDSPKLAIACPHCGKQAEGHKRFCPHCGKPLHEPAPRSIPAAQPAPQSTPVLPLATPLVAPPPLSVPAVAVSPQSKGRRGVWPFILGLAVPIILAGLLLLALILLGVFEEPETPPQLESAAQALSEEEGDDDEAEGTPSIEDDGQQAISPFNFRAYNPDTDQNLSRQSDLAEYPATESDERPYEYLIPLNPGQDLVLESFYCGKTDELLADVSAVTSVSFQVAQTLFTEESMYFELSRTDTRSCHVYRGVLYDLAPGEYYLVQTLSVSEQVYDGWETWGPEELTVTILLRVGDEAGASSDDGQQGQTVAPPEEREIMLIEGDARAFATPPQVIAYANTQARPLPAEIVIEEGCGEDCWRFNEWIGINVPGQWIKGYSTIPTTAIGIQFWGDANDGQARVYLDGEEVWSGDTRGEDNQWPGGAFVRYLQVSGLPEMSHSLMVESLDPGRSITLYFFGIGPSTP